MRIVFLTGNLSYGGAPKILIRVANYLAGFHDVHIVNYGYNENFYKINERIIFCDHIVSRPNNIITKVIGAAKRFVSFSRYVLKIKPDILVAFDNTEKLFITIAGKLFNCKSIICERKDPYTYKPGKKNVMYWRYNHADGCIFQTEGAKNYFSDKVKQKSIVIPNFIDPISFKIEDWNHRNDSISFVGRFDLPAKRQDIMIEAFRIVHEQFPNFKLVFYGGGNGIGENQELIQKKVEEYNLVGNVEFAGVVKPVTDYIAKNKLFVITSAYEGIPNVLLEAMACGLPCVSTDCSPGGARFLIKDKYNGRLVPVNDVAAIAQAIIDYIMNPSLADENGKAAKKTSEEYKPEVILPLWKQYMEGIIDE